MATPRFEAICNLCEYYVPGVDPENQRGIPVCIAFPEGIPEEILHGGQDHRQPIGNEAITFKRAEGVTEEDVDEWERTVLEQEKSDMLGMIEHMRGQPPAE